MRDSIELQLSERILLNSANPVEHATLMIKEDTDNTSIEYPHK